MNIAKTSIKSATLATIIFNGLILSEEGFENETLLILFLSFILFIVLSFFAIFFTIYPIYLTNKKEQNNKQIFHKYFPYYTLILFIFCFGLDFYDKYDKVGLLVGITTFFTAVYAWVDLFREEDIKTKI